jgi:hypothetical protein
VILALYGAKPGSEAFQTASGLLDEFLEQLAPFPTPWGLKWVAEGRGLMEARFAQPVAPERRDAAKRLQQWMVDWLPNAVSRLSSTR